MTESNSTSRWRVGYLLVSTRGSCPLLDVPAALWMADFGAKPSCGIWPIAEWLLWSERA